MFGGHEARLTSKSATNSYWGYNKRSRQRSAPFERFEDFEPFKSLLLTPIGYGNSSHVN